MTTDRLKHITIRPLKKGEALPWALLLDADPFEGAINKYLGQSEVYIALSDKALVGIYVLFAQDAETLEIKNIAVAEPFQNKGIGKLLLHDAAQKAKEKGANKLLIGTSNASSTQLHLYQSQGFEITAIKENFFIENYPEPLFENGIQCKHMVMLTKQL